MAKLSSKSCRNCSGMLIQDFFGFASGMYQNPPEIQSGSDLSDLDHELKEEDLWEVLETSRNNNSKTSVDEALQKHAITTIPFVAFNRRSAPLKIPEWSLIVGVDENIEEEGAEEADQRVPPHELVARQYGCNSPSVVEGYGRTLKGRDASRVRNAVWLQTGFTG